MKKKGASPNTLKSLVWGIMSYQNGWKKKLIIDIRIDMSNVKVGYGVKKVFNDLNRSITDISNNKVKKENAIERFLKSISDLNQLKQKK